MEIEYWLIGIGVIIASLAWATRRPTRTSSHSSIATPVSNEKTNDRYRSQQQPESEPVVAEHDDIESCRASVAELRQLAAQDPETYNEDLADSMHSLMTKYVLRGRDEEALAAEKELVAFYRQLAATNPAYYNETLAEQLNALASNLISEGEEAEAAAVGQEAVALFRQVKADQPHFDDIRLAGALQINAYSLNEIGEHQAAVLASREALEHYQNPMLADGDIYHEDIASSLQYLASGLLALGEHQEAVVHSRTSVGLWRKQQGEDDDFQLSLAEALEVHSQCLAQESPKEAINSINEAIALLDAMIDDGDIEVVPWRKELLSHKAGYERL